MQTEIEATFVDVDHAELRQKLKALGAECTDAKYDVKRTIYDYPDLRLDKQAAWIRVRQESGKVTMCFKQREAETIDGMKEVEFEVSDYDKANDFLESIGLKVKASQESTREIWQLKSVEIMLDEWPWIPAIAEVEGPNEQAVKQVSESLGLDYSSAMFDSIDGVYLNYFDVSRTEISTVPLVFDNVPEWLEAKRKNN